MGLLGHEHFEDWKELFIHQLEDIYDAENRLVDALPKMKDAASRSELQSAFTEHLEETRGHVSRLEQVFKSMDKEPSRETCPAMQGLIKEGQEMIEAEGDHDVKDAALIAAAQRVEHYEMAAYGTLKTLSQKLGYEDATNQLNKNLEEEKAADSKLTRIAESYVNPPVTA